MSCGAPLWIVYAVKGILFIAGLVVIVLMQRAEHDQQINRIDAERFRNARRLSFMAVAAFAWFLAIAIGRTDYALLVFLGLLLATIAVMAVDIMALDHRPPNNGHRSAFSGQRRWAPVRHVLAVLRPDRDPTK